MFKIESSAPETIVYEYGEGKTLTLGETTSSAPVVTAVITWDGSAKDYVETWYVNYGKEDQEPIEINLNTSFTETTEEGFMDQVFKVEHGITYSTSNSSVINDEPNLVINGTTDETFLHVTIFGVTRYLKLVVLAPDFKLEKTQADDIAVIEGVTGYLSNIIDYKYNNN